MCVLSERALASADATRRGRNHSGILRVIFAKAPSDTNDSIARLRQRRLPHVHAKPHGASDHRLVQILDVWQVDEKITVSGDVVIAERVLDPLAGDELHFENHYHYLRNPFSAMTLLRDI